MKPQDGEMTVTARIEQTTNGPEFIIDASNAFRVEHFHYSAAEAKRVLAAWLPYFMSTKEDTDG